jgi:hypothetical protein
VRHEQFQLGASEALLALSGLNIPLPVDGRWGNAEKAAGAVADARTPTATVAPVLVVTATPVPTEADPVQEDAPPAADGPTTRDERGVSEQDSVADTPPTADNGPGNVNTATSPLTATINVDVLNIRAAPDLASAVVDQLTRNAQVTLQQQDSTQLWWYVCCGTINQQAGWVSAQFLTIMTPATITAQPIPRAAPLPVELALIPQQRFVWQGQQLTVTLSVTNPNSESVRHLDILCALPADLIFVGAAAVGDGRHTMENSATMGQAVRFSWPEIAPAAQVTGSITVQIASTAANGAFLTLLATATVDGAPPQTQGIAVAMPPAQLPSFQ